MGLYRRLIINLSKSKMVFRANYLLSTLFSFFYIFLQVFIWKGLYGNSSDWNGIRLNEMIAYTILSSMTLMLVKSNLMKNLNAEVQDGSISIRLLLPHGFRSYYFKSNLSENMLWSIYNSLPPIIVAIVVFGLEFNFSVIQLFGYILAVVLAFLMNFSYSFFMGLAVMWFRNAYFLENIDELVFKLFSGTIIPMWLFPLWLDSTSRVLPFRYMIFEPLSILLGKTPPNEYINVYLIQLVWCVVLFALMQLVWYKARKKIMIQGG